MNNDKSKIMKRLSNALNANDMESARHIINQDIKRYADKCEYYFYLALVSDDLNEKLELYTKAIDENCNYLDAYINRGLVRNELQDYAGSIEDYNKAIEIDSKCSLAYNNRGYTKYKLQDHKGALEDYNKAILLNPKLKIALDNKAKLLMEVCLKDDSNFSEKYYLSLGINEINNGNFIEAIKNIDESLKYNDSSAIAYFYKAACFHSLNNSENAIRYYTKAIELDKKMIDAYYNRAQTILAFEKPTEDELQEALDDLIKATELDDKFIDAYYYAATIKKKFEDYEGAIELLDKVLELEPQAPYSRALKKLIEQKYLGR